MCKRRERGRRQHVEKEQRWSRLATVPHHYHYALPSRLTTSIASQREGRTTLRCYDAMKKEGAVAALRQKSGL
ncbi:ABC transporter substrate-binding protein [Sesbania bispinosa]|nr:ABC transporter substrate-binding protein [Sesbania bispinosa]